MNKLEAVYSCCMSDPKTIGPTGARLLAAFSQRDPAVFTLEQAVTALGTSPQVVSNLLTKLVRQGWVVRVRSGTYEVAPIWADQDTYFADRFATLAASLTPPYYVGYQSALELYGWLQHPVIGRLYVAVPTKRHQLNSPRDRVIWIVTKQERFAWGLRQQWIGQARITVSDRERTFLDCLHLPRHAGGIVDIAGALVRAWPALDLQRLAESAIRLGNSSVIRRLGVIIESLDLDGGDRVTSQLPLQPWLGRPVSLDPSLLSGGPVDKRWGVRMNVPPDELAAVGST